ncbi:hypothetical protein FGB62_58g030 [Gracilaria domingensis]|nr:hypothetical protein FGB62_58g030 [Gracilaria domingensis]
MAMRLALEMRQLNAYFRENPVHIPPLCREAVCSLRHTDGVHCRRKKSAVLSEDAIPATHVANPSAQPVPDTLDSDKTKPAADLSAQAVDPNSASTDHDDGKHSEQSHGAEEPKPNSAVVDDAPVQPAQASDQSSPNSVSKPTESNNPTPEKPLVAEERQQRSDGQAVAPNQVVISQATQNGHLDEGDTAQSLSPSSKTPPPNDAESESQEGDLRKPSSMLASGPGAQNGGPSDWPVSKDVHENEEVSIPESPTKEQLNSISSTAEKEIDQFTPEPVVASAPDQTARREQANENEAPAVERPTDGDEKPTSVHTQTAQPNVVAALSSVEPVGEQTGEKQGSENCAATTAETCSNQDGDTVATKDASAEEPSTTLAAAEPDQGTTTETSQQPNSAEAEESASLEAPVEGMEQSRPATDRDGADREGDKTSNGQPDEGHTGPRDDADAQNNADSNVEQPDVQTSDGEENVTAPNTEADAEGNPDGEGDGDATANVAAETAGDDTTANAEDNAGVTAETADDDGSNANAEDDANANAEDDANANADATSNAGSNAGSNADDNSNADVESDVVDSASLAASEEPELPVYEVDPSESEPKEWHKTFDVWNVFHQRNMLDDVIHFMSNFGCDNYIALLLDVILKQLEPTLSDDEILRFLRKCDWVWDAPAFSVLSELGKNWGQRAWRLLACARTGYYGEGREYQMFWNYTHLAGHIRLRAAEVANKGSDSESESSHSSAPDDGFTAIWGQKVMDDEFEFTMSLNIGDVGEPWDDLSPLYLKIRLLEKEDSVISAESAKRKVTARVNVIESGCGCVLGGDAPKVGTTASSSDGTLIRSVIDGFRFMNGSPSGTGGYSYSVMNGQVLKSWLEKHTRHCGLAFHVRLYVAPCNEDDSDTSSESSQEVAECTCGYCVCAGCDRESDAEKESVYSGNDDGSDENDS